jgi:cytochrome c-type biogenesis protein CcmH/NrfG
MLRRTKNRAFGVLIALAVPAIALIPLGASGEPKKPAKPVAGEKSEKSDKYDPENIVGISQFMETIAKGNERFAAKDFTAAIDAYKKAVQLSPKNALGHYLLAEAYLSQGNMGEAEASIREAHEAGDLKNPALRSRVLFLVADVFERQKKWDQAKTAWQAYTEHASKHADAGYPQTGADRLKAIQKVLDNEKAYVAVRERIAAEKADAGKAPPPPKK